MSLDPSEDALRARLGRLLAAVPIEGDTSPSLGESGVARPRVVPRMAFGLSGLTIAIAAIVVAVLAFGQRPSVGGPVIGVATDGPFKLTITVPRATYAAGEPITGITASLEYTGADGSIWIAHSAGGPLGFAVRSADGRHETVPVHDLACAGSDLSVGHPATAAFGKSGGYWPEESDYPWLSSFFATRDLVLDPGQWTITAVASFDEVRCGGVAHDIRASVTIGIIAVGVSLAPSAAPTDPAGMIDGLPVMTVSQVLDARARGELQHKRVAVGGWWSDGSVRHSCVPSMPSPGELELYCHDGEYGVTELDERIMVVDQQGYVTAARGPHMTPWFPNDLPGLAELFSLPIINGQRYPPVPIVLVGHFDDPMSDACQPQSRQLCLDRLVVERIASFDPGSVPTPGVSPSPTPFPSPAPPGLFGPDQCSGDIPYSFVGWTTTQELRIQFDRPGHVWAMVTRDVVKLTEGDWQDDPNGSGHQFQIWGQRVCLAEEDPHNPGPATTMEFAAVDGTTYVLWDDGLKTPGESPVRPAGS